MTAVNHGGKTTKPVDETANKSPDRIERIYYDKRKTILKEEIPYKNNRMDGRLRSETFYVNGVADGPFAVLSFYTSLNTGV
ncbi:MAG: hypothetical protein LBO80_05305 [Treponema sp.]|nr:hypothetical protein [Treponema sp.]